MVVASDCAALIETRGVHTPIIRAERLFRRLRRRNAARQPRPVHGRQPLQHQGRGKDQDEGVGDAAGQPQEKKGRHGLTSPMAAVESALPRQRRYEPAAFAAGEKLVRRRQRAQ